MLVTLTIVTVKKGFKRFKGLKTDFVSFSSGRNCIQCNVDIFQLTLLVVESRICLVLKI